jgi:hypothetical protein
MKKVFAKNLISLAEYLNKPFALQYGFIYKTSNNDTFYNVKETDLPFVKAILTRQDFIEYIQASGEKYDFSKVSYKGIPSKKYKLTGEIRF